MEPLQLEQMQLSGVGMGFFSSGDALTPLAVLTLLALALKL